LAAPHVLGVGDQFDVIGVAAGSVAAEVVDLKAVRDFPHE
jgi:hypothetical protein